MPQTLITASRTLYLKPKHHDKDCFDIGELRACLIFYNMDSLYTFFSCLFVFIQCVERKAGTENAVQEADTVHIC